MSLVQVSDPALRVAAFYLENADVLAHPGWLQLTNLNSSVLVKAVVPIHTSSTLSLSDLLTLDLRE